MLHIIGIIISLFLSLLLFTKKGKSDADLVLALWLFLISFHLLSYYLLASEQFSEFPYFLGLEIAMPFIHGPFLFLYTALITGKQVGRLHCFFHFLPVILIYLALSEFFLLTPAEKVLVYRTNGAGYTTLLKIIHFAILPSGIAYIAGSLFLLKAHRRNLSNQASYLEKINLNWLRNLTIGMGMIWLSILFGNDRSTFTFVDLFILFIGYFGIKQVGIFTNRMLSPVEEKTKALEPEKIKYEKSTLTENAAQKIHAELLAAMEAEKLFKDAELTLGALAKYLSVHPSVLSEVINTMERKSFYDYINELRIEEFKVIVVLPENQKFTLLSLAYEVGFNSKTSFNRNFKNITGWSPTAYLQQQKIQLQAAT